MKRGGLEIEITVGDDSIRGLLVWDQGPSLATVKEVLDRFIHGSLGEAAQALVTD